MANININENEPGAFFICTETSPRCYIIQRVNASSVDRMVADLQTHATDSDTPPTPALPWWFTPECESQLISASSASSTSSLEARAQGKRSPVPAIKMKTSTPSVTAPSRPQPVVPPPPPSQPLSLSANTKISYTLPHTQRSAVIPQQHNDIKQQLKSQLEYYFSRENLMTDRFLRCQMDNDQYVPIRIIAGFPKVKRLTSDFDLIVQVLRESNQVQVDETGERVRAASRRCTIILREIPETTDEKEVASMFAGGPPYISIQYGLNNSWYVMFDSEEATQRAFLHLQNRGKTFNNKPICARIKTGGAPYSDNQLPLERALSTLPTEAVPETNIPINSSTTIAPAENFDLGQVLASYGYVPRATYKPGAAVVHVNSTVDLMSRINMSRIRGSNSANHYRSGGRGRGGGGAINGLMSHRVLNGHRDYGNTNYQHSCNRRSSGYNDSHWENYRDRNDSYRSRGRYIRPNSFNFGLGNSRSRTPVEMYQHSRRNDNRQRISSEFNHDYNIPSNSKQSNSKRDSYSKSHNTNGKSFVSRPIIQTPDGSKKYDDRHTSSSLIEETKSEPSNSKIESEYNFEEGAFPSLSVEVTEKKVSEMEKPIERPTFSSVAAGRKREKKEQKEKKKLRANFKAD